MGHLHRAFLLNVGGFTKEIAPILTSLDRGDARPLYEKSVTIIRQTPPEQWILRLAGANLLDISKVDSMGRPWKTPIQGHLEDASTIPPYEVGYWLLIVFSNFVQRCVGIGYDYNILDGALFLLGWDQEERRLLFEGKPTSLLLKPNKLLVPVASYTDPYWHWMIPTHSKSRGWLSQENISKLHHRLLLIKEAVQSFDPKKFETDLSGFWLEVHEKEEQQYYYERLQVTFERAITMLKTSQANKSDLFMTISYS